MARYKRVLLAVDFFVDSDQIVDRAVQVAADNEAELLLVHAVEPLATAYPANGMAGWGPEVVSLQSELRDQAEKRLSDLAARLGVKKENVFLRDGRAASEIHRVAEEKNVDLIVLGTHGQHGIQLLLGSTANSVLHGVSCDVLAVRTRQK